MAKSVICENQAFQVGRNVIGLQLHLEATPESVRAILDNCGDELVPGLYIQAESELRTVENATYVKINSIANNALSYLTSTSG